MLPSKRRIERKYFKNIIQKGRKYSSKSFLLYVLPIQNGSGICKSKFSFSVSKKVEKYSVKRNKLRRRGYSIIKNQFKDIKDGYFLFFSYKKNYETVYEKLEQEIIALLSSCSMII